MKCSEALEMMLDAEFAELSPDGSSTLAVHLRSCAKCARLAATMRADIRLLATVLPHTAAPARSPWVLWSSIAFASAVVAFFAVVKNERPILPAAREPADIAPVVVAPPTEVVQRVPPPKAVHAEPRSRRAASARYAMPDPVPLDGPAVFEQPTSPAAAPEPTFDGVSASSDGRVTVLKTSNPKITVIWFN